MNKTFWNLIKAVSNQNKKGQKNLRYPTKKQSIFGPYFEMALVTNENQIQPNGP